MVDRLIDKCEEELMKSVTKMKYETKMKKETEKHPIYYSPIPLVL